jgi:hypothetical protein
MKAYQSKALRQILRDVKGRESLRAFFERRGPEKRMLRSATAEPTAIVETSEGHRFSVRLVPTR